MSMKQFWGKYRGIVVGNEDPLMLGRIQVSVPQALGEVLTAWAMPCVPYAGLQVGFCMLPPIGAGVWVEFEGGDLDYPIWVGCFWREGERPVTAELPTMRMIQTSTCKLVLNDTPGEGGFTLSVMDPAVTVPITIKASSTGLSITLMPVSIDVSERGVTIMADPAILSLGELGVTLAHGAAMISATEPEVSINEGSLTVL
jgi:Type VI secretion system/phage-baseplate injector OB domain